MAQSSLKRNTPNRKPRIKRTPEVVRNGGIKILSGYPIIPSRNLMGTSTGIDLIEEEVVRIAYGDLA